MSSGRLEIRTLGGLTARTSAGQELSFPTRKAALLLAYLALAPNQPRSRSQLAALLWGDRGEEQARGSLRQALFAVRQRLDRAGCPALATTNDNVTLDGTMIEVDAVQAAHLCGAQQPEDLRALKSLYQGPLLEGQEIPDAPFMEWLRTERSRLETAVLDALRRLLALESAAGNELAALATAEQICAIDALCEEGHRAAIRLRAARGDRAGALRLFEQLQTALKQELRADPEPETAALALRLRRGLELPSVPRIKAETEVLPAIVGDADHQPPQTTANLEQRYIAVLAAELFTDLSEGDDPEARHAFLGAWTRGAEEAIRFWGGFTERRGETLLLGIFGATRAYGNDCERALRAVDTLERSLAQAVGVQGSISCGISSGPALVEVPPDKAALPLVSGTTIDEAERLARHAQPGERLLTPAARDNLGARVEVEPVATIDRGPKTIWRLRRFQPDVAVDFIGRTAELAQLEAAFQSCLKRRHGRIVHIRGEPGIGKTRLAEEARRRAIALGFQSHTAIVLDFGGHARRDPIRNLVRNLCGLEDYPDTTTSLGEVAARVAAGFEGAKAAFVYDLLDTPGPASIQAVLDSVDDATRKSGIRAVASDLIAASAAEQPRLIVVEDVQWIDLPALDGLATLATVTATHPVIMVLTSRIEGDPLTAAWRAKTHSAPLTTIDLGPMAADEADALATALGATDPQQRAQCLARAAGHPLFLEQLARLGQAGRKDQSVPSSIQSIVQVRLDQLPASAKHDIQAAAVLGQRFAADALGFLVQQSSVDLEPLIAQGLIRQDGSAYTFAHALLRDGIYETILPRRRRAWHRRAGEWFADLDLVLHAEHLEQAQDERAPEAFRAAAEAQRKAYRYERAKRLVDRGAALAHSPHDRVNLALLAGDIDHDRGDMTGALKAYETALTAAPTDLLLCRAMIGRATIRRVTDDLEGAFGDVIEAQRLAERATPHEAALIEQARALFLKGNLYFPRSDAQRCLNAHETSLALAREAHRPDLEAEALGGIGDAQYLAGKFKSAHETLRGCVEISRAHGFGRTQVANHSQCAIAAVFFMPQRDALAMLQTAEESADAVGHKRSAINSCAGQIWALLELGEFERCFEKAEDARRRIRELGAVRYDQLALMGLGVALVRLGDKDQGLDLLRQATSVAEQTGPGFHGAEAYAHLALHTPDLQESEVSLTRCEAILKGRNVGHSPPRAHPLAAAAARRLGDLDRARAHLDALAQFTAAEPLAIPSFYIDMWRFLLERYGKSSSAEHYTVRQDLVRRARDLHLFDAIRIYLTAEEFTSAR